MPDFYEFFAGGGMARAGLGDGWRCLLANDFSAMKARAYRANWGADHLIEGDVGAIRSTDLPGRADLVWASTPCQDLSLAGNAVGLGRPGGAQTRSGAFWPWWTLMEGLAAEGRKPRVIVFENVVGALSSNRGADFRLVAGAFARGGYRFGAMVVDARHWLPQSRPRLFIVGLDEAADCPAGLCADGPQAPWHSTAVQAAHDGLPDDLRRQWLWWSLPQATGSGPALANLIDDEPDGAQWHSKAETERLLDMMSPANALKLDRARRQIGRQVGCVYKRTRPGPDGARQVRAEVRFDGVAGCLRTPSGGSSRQTVIIVDGQRVRTRLLAPREAARLMGLPDSYRLPGQYNDAYHLCGDGVAVPVVRHLAAHLLEPLTRAPLEHGRA
jgi:DNA (cytosine-5)-methyltransferase 1